MPVADVAVRVDDGSGTGAAVARLLQPASPRPTMPVPSVRAVTTREGLGNMRTGQGTLCRRGTDRRCEPYPLGEERVDAVLGLHRCAGSGVSPGEKATTAPGNGRAASRAASVVVTLRAPPAGSPANPIDAGLMPW